MRLFRPLLALPLLLAVASCKLGQLEQSSDLNLRPLVAKVAARHDAYVAADLALDPTTKAAYTAQSAKVLQAFDVATVPVAPLKSDLDAVLDRHDAYVNSDAALGAMQKQLALLSAQNIRRTVDEAAR